VLIVPSEEEPPTNQRLPEQPLYVILSTMPEPAELAELLPVSSATWEAVATYQQLA